MKTNHNLLVSKQKLAFPQTDLLYLFIVISVHFTYN